MKYLLILIITLPLNLFAQDTLKVNKLLDNWHKAAAYANEEAYFNKMDDNAIYMGTDATERWTKSEFQEWAKPYFNKGKAWNFKVVSRHIYFSDDNNSAWFDETLDTWMGDIRGSGVLVYKNNEWKIKHYNLSVPIPNEAINEVLPIIKEKINK